jgi:ABC-type transport system involved in multi-copper enzyme maturation permease subunit
VSIVSQYVRDNPVLLLELRTRMRGSRAAWLMFGYLSCLSAMVCAGVVNQSLTGSSQAGAQIGSTLFTWLYNTQALLAVLISPALTCGAITAEKEQRTWELTQLTRISRGAIVTGKLLSCLLYACVLLTASLPILSLTMLLGGVSPEEILSAYVSLICLSLLSGSVGIAWSSLCSTTQQSIGWTYATILSPCIVFGSLQMITTMRQGGGTTTVTSLSAALLLGSPNALGHQNDFLQWWNGARYFGISLPNWVQPVALVLLVTVLLGATASARLEAAPQRKGLLLRTLTGLSVLAAAWFMTAARFSALSAAAPPDVAASVSAHPLPAGWIVLAWLFPVLTVVFCTGEITADERRRPSEMLRRMASPHLLPLGVPSSGPLYLLMLLGVLCLQYAAAFVSMGLPFGGSGVAGAAIPGSWTTSAACIAASIVGFGMLGLMISTLTGSRWSALLISSAVVLMVFVVPEVSAARFVANPHQFGIGIGLALSYLNPAAAVYEQMVYAPSASLPMPLGSIPIRSVLPAAHLILASVCILCMLSASHFYRGRLLLRTQSTDTPP